MQQDNQQSNRTISTLFGYAKSTGLTWFPQFGVGYYPAVGGNSVYNQAYFNRYRLDADKPIGRRLMNFRVEFVAEHYRGDLCDVGIGCGAFIQRRGQKPHRTLGYDVNPAGIKWLIEQNLFTDPYLVPFKAITLFDVLEHMHDFLPLLDNVGEWVFITVPIFECEDHALSSKHFRTDEHYWYFTEIGLCEAMKLCGFQLVSLSDMEKNIGREDVRTYAFRRCDMP